MTYHSKVNSVTWPLPDDSTVEFELHPIGTTFNPVGGVYIFCRTAGDGQWNPVYVGETGDFNERLNTGLQSHQAWPCIKRNGGTHICVRVVSGAAARLDLETKLRQSLNPPCNKQ